MTFRAAIVVHVVGLCADTVFVLWLVFTAAATERATSTLSSILRKEAAHSRSDHSDGEKGSSYCSRPHSAVTLSKCLWQFSVCEVRGSDSGDHKQSSLL